MMRGVVTAEQEAVVRLTVYGEHGRKRSIQAIIDTGFTGYLSLPPDIISRLQLAWIERGTAILGDGSLSLFDVYGAAVLWDGRRRQIIVDGADTAPLIGMSLLADKVLQLEAWDGGEVTIKRRKRRR
jgi:clan AA aspartic protease